jgi:hypothetical protein
VVEVEVGQVVLIHTQGVKLMAMEEDHMKLHHHLPLLVARLLLASEKSMLLKK